jgi:hypothetical protein
MDAERCTDSHLSSTHHYQLTNASYTAAQRNSSHKLSLGIELVQECQERGIDFLCSFQREPMAGPVEHGPHVAAQAGGHPTHQSRGGTTLPAAPRSNSHLLNTHRYQFDVPGVRAGAK